MTRNKPDLQIEALLTTGEVAAMLSVDPRTVTRWTNNGILPDIRLPSGHRRIRLSDIQKFLGSGSADGE